MALSRLKLLEAEIGRQTRWSGRWLSSDSRDSKEEKVEAVKSFVQRYIQKYAGVFPGAKEVQDEVGGSLKLLGNILEDLKTKLLPGSEVVENVANVYKVAEPNLDTTSFGGYMGSDKLDQDHKTLSSATEMIDVEESISFNDASIVGNKDNNNKLDEMIGVDELTNLDNICIGRNSSSDTLDQDCKTSALPEEMIDAEGSLEFSGDTVLSMMIRREQSLSSHKPSEKTLRQRLPDTTSHIGKEEDDSGTYDANNHLDMTVSNEDTLDKDHEMQSENLALDMNPQKINHSIFSLQDMSTAQHNAKSSQNVNNLVEFFKRNTKKENDLSLANSLNSEEDAASCQPKDNKCLDEFVDEFNQNPRKSGNDFIMSKKNLQKPLSNVKLGHQDPEMLTKVKGIFADVFKILNQTSLSERRASQPYMKNDNGKQDCSSFLHARRAPLCSNVKSENKLCNLSARGKESGRINVSNSLLENNRRENGNISSDTGEGNSFFNQTENVKALEPKGSRFMSEGDSDASLCRPQHETSKKDSFVAQGLNLSESGKHGNQLIIKFLLKSSTVDDIRIAFRDCGPISKVSILPTKRESRYNHAYVAFKTCDGLKRALSKTDVDVCGADVSLQPASPIVLNDRFTDMQRVNDAEFPAAFLRDPARTVLIKGLPVNLSCQQLEHKFASLGPISGIAMGPSGSSIYVEFESEESKERALAMATTSLLGSRLFIYRIDAPNTTILRISRVKSLSGIDKVQKICETYGQVKRVVHRDDNTFDVHYKLSEQINMLVILNSLNGLVVDRHRWFVQPATVIPPEILQTLWKTTEGRKQIYDLFGFLCKAIQEKSIDTNPLCHLAQDCFSTTD